MKSEYVGAGGGAVIWSFSNHVVSLMRTVLDISEQDRVIIAVPLIRLMVENTMTGIWLYLEPSNIMAILKEGFTKRKAAIGNIIETGAEGFGSSDLEEVDRILGAFDNSTLPPFEQRCRQIDGGLSVYCTWRVMSTYSHAGMGMADFYLEEIEEEPGLALVPDAGLENHEAWLGTAICMLIAAMKLVDNIDYAGGLKSQLERAAQRMGISLAFAKASKT